MYKLNNPLVVIDLEATTDKDERGFQTNDCIIDIGAVYLDENLKTLSSFSHLVKPEQPINDFIQRLTGITPAMVEKEASFSEIGSDFVRWIESLAGSLKKVRLAAWGNYFDIPLLRRNYQNNGCEFPFSGTALDVKTIAFLWLSLSGRRTDNVNLDFFAKHFGIVPEGKYHRALTDAQVAAEVLVRLWKDLEGFFVPGKEGDPYRAGRVVWS